MKLSHVLLTGAVTAGLMMGSAASAATFAVFDGITDGVTTFDNTVTGGGGTVNVDVWDTFSSGISVDRGDYTVTANDGGFLSATSYGSLSGLAVGIDPAGGGSNPRTDPLDYFESGFTLSFDDAVNAVGFEVGDWATCCFDPTTDLFISFDGGSPITVASASTDSDGLFPTQSPNSTSDVYEIFVAAFDDTGSFSSVSFWGNGIGEYLVSGGQVRYGLIDEGSLPVPVVPLPAAGWLLLAGVGGLSAMRRRKKA